MSDSPVAVLADQDGNLVGVTGGRLQVTDVGSSGPDDASYVVLTQGPQKYHSAYFVNAALPASIEAAGSAPYAVGGTDLTVTIDGEGTPTVASFPTRAAQNGYAVGGASPWPKDGFPNTKEKIKVSVDGGALTEVKIGKTHTTWAEVASALQTKIRSDVPNGSNVIVEYNSATYPLRFSAYSGTTGASSSIHFEKGGDDLAKDMQMMVGYDYFEIEGVAANSYRSFEVVEILSEELHDITVTSAPITITTRATGTSASLQVTSGGANTALQFPTSLVSGQNGTGSDDLSADGSVTNLFYAPEVPTGRVFVVNKVVMLIRCTSADLKKFGGLDQLAYGVVIEFRQEDQALQTSFTAVTNAELFAYMGDGEVFVDAYDGGNELVRAVRVFDPGIRIREGTVDRLQIKIQDNLSDAAMVWFKAFAEGWLE